MLYFFVALAFVTLGYFVALPLLQGSATIAETPADGEPLAARSTNSPSDDATRLQNALTELDFDHSTGKTNDEDWQAARTPIEARLQRFNSPQSEQPISVSDLEIEIEVLITRARLRHRRQSTLSA